MPWFRRKDKKIKTLSTQKKETPDGLWKKTPHGIVVTKEDLEVNNYVSQEDDHHFGIGSDEYFKIIFDNEEFTELANNILPIDPLEFVDTAPYTERLKSYTSKTNLTDAIKIGFGKLSNNNLVIACMDYSFMGGSMGSVVGERISKAIDKCLELKSPLLLISTSGGARMQEAGLSLMQMVKTSAKLRLLSDNKLPFISYITNPTYGGVTASFAMLGDLNIAEPKASIGFAGPRVIKDTTKKDLPEGFQTAEFLIEKGFLDMIIDRRDLKEKLSEILNFFNK